MTDLPKPETMLAYASILEKPQYVEKNGVRFPIPTGEIIEAACAALRHCAALAALPPAGWRDISTAPKDGTRILATILERPQNTYVVRYRENSWQVGPLGEWVVYPTHWMPLPPAPQRTGE